MRYDRSTMSFGHASELRENTFHGMKYTHR